MGEVPLSFNGFTYFLMTHRQDMWISELSLSFGEFTYSLKTQEQEFGLVDYHCHLMDSLAS